MKRPVGSILLGLFLLSQIILQGGRLWPALPAIGRTSPAASAWTALLPTRASVAVTLPGTLVLKAENGSYWRLSPLTADHVEALATTTVSQELPGGVMIAVRLARLGGAERILGVSGATAWASPDGRAAAVYDRTDQAYWALLASDVRPRPLGAVDPEAPAGLAWSAHGDRLVYLSGRPGHLWAWRVGTYAHEIAGAYGMPAAVRADGGMVLTTHGRDPALYLPRVGVAVPVAAGRVLSVSPDGRDALLAHDGHVYLTELETGSATRLPGTPSAVAQAVWSAGDSVAILWAGGRGRHEVLVATQDGGVRSLRAPTGVSATGTRLVAFSVGRVLCVFERSGVGVTYMRSAASSGA